MCPLYHVCYGTLSRDIIVTNYVAGNIIEIYMKFTEGEVCCAIREYCSPAHSLNERTQKKVNVNSR